MLFIKTAAHLDAKLQHLMQSPAYVCPLNTLACFPSLLAEDARNSDIKRKRKCLKLELWVILEQSQGAGRDCHFARDPARGSFHHHSPLLGSCHPEAWVESWWWGGGARCWGMGFAAVVNLESQKVVQAYQPFDFHNWNRRWWEDSNIKKAFRKTSDRTSWLLRSQRRLRSY